MLLEIRKPALRVCHKGIAEKKYQEEHVEINFVTEREKKLGFVFKLENRWSFKPCRANPWMQT